MASRSRLLFVLLAVVLTAAAAGSQASRASGPSDLLDVVQVNGLSSAGQATAITPVAWNGTTATVGSPLALPTADAGGQHALLESGSASSDAELNLSADGNYLTLGGYGGTLGQAKIGSAAGVPRVIARIDGAGHIDTSTAFTDALAGANFRSVASDDGTHFWIGGDGSSAAGAAKNVHVAYVPALGSSTWTSLETTLKDRDVVVSGGNVYFSSNTGTGGIFQLGSGLQTTAVAPTPLLTEANPYSFVLLHTGPSPGNAPDTLYLADGANPPVATNGLYKYTYNGTSWVASGAVTGVSIAGLTGKVENGAVQLYATTFDDGSPQHNDILALTDSSGFGNNVTASFTEVASSPTGTAFRGIAFAPNGQTLSVGPPTIALSDVALSRAIGDSYAPNTFTATISDSAYLGDQLTVTASSSAHGSAANPVTGVSVSGSGSTRTLTVSTSDTVGLADVHVTVTTPDGRSASATLEYGVSGPAPTPTSNFLTGFSNGSTAIDVGDGYFVVGDDALNQLELFKGGVSGPPVATWNFDPQLGVADSSQLDLEASARLGDTIYWFGSLGNNSTGQVKPNRAIVFATTLDHTSGAATQLSFAGFYKGLRNDLISWDNANGAQYGFAAGSAEGQLAKQIDGFNLEGAEFAAGGSSTVYLGFRAPIVPTSDRTQALVVPLTNLASLMSSTGDAGSAAFGTPLQWNLTPPGDPNVKGVREIRKNADDQYLIIAGSWGEAAPAPSGGAEVLYTWDGVPAHAPVLSNTVLPTPDNGSWETIVSVPDPLVDGAPVRFVEDDGDDDYYGDGSEAKDLTPALQKERTDVFDVALTPQTVTFTSSPASPAYASTTYTVSATGGASGQPVTFSIDPSSAGVCTIAGTLVTLTAPGACVIDADQAATFQYAAGHATQTVTVVQAPAPVVTPVITGTLGNAGWYVSPVTVSWTVVSPLPATQCAPTTLTADTTSAGTSVTCSSTSQGGTTTIATPPITIDRTGPTIAFTGNAGTYTVAQNVSITCNATDPAPGSGLASSTCVPVNAPAWTFGLGAKTVSASATDVAGNTRDGSTSFTVTVSPATLCTLTTQFVKTSANYARLAPAAQRAVDVLTTGACTVLAELTAKAKPATAAAALKAYTQAVNGLASSGWLTKPQAATLVSFAASL